VDRAYPGQRLLERRRGARVATFADGDVLVAGSLNNADTGIDFGVLRLAAEDGDTLWSASFNAQVGAVGNEWALDVAVDSNGDVIAVGALEDFPAFAVKLAGATGQELWHYQMAESSAQSVVLTGAGEAIVGGTGRIVKLRGTDGAILWNHDSNFVAAHVALAADGSVYAAGHTSPAADFAVLKLDGTDGSLLWSYSIDGPVSEFDVAWKVAVDPDGNVIACGEQSVESFLVDGVLLTRKEAVIVKLDGSDGSVIWNRMDGSLLIPSAEITALQIDANGEAYLTALDAEGSGPIGRVLKISGADGTDVWSVGSLAAGVLLDAATALRLNGNDVVATAGLILPGGAVEWGAFALSQSDGTERWLRLAGIKPLPFQIASLPELAADTRGGIAVAGTAPRANGRYMAVVRLASAVHGHKVVWSEADASHGEATLLIKMKDRGLFVASPGSGGDPRLHGGSLEIRNPDTGESVSLPLPAAGWSGTGQPEGSKGYGYTDLSGAAGPCSRVRIRNGMLSARCRGNLGFSLDETSQGALRFVVRTGGLATCAHFGGQIEEDSGGAAQAGRFKAAGSAPNDACAPPL
jgi:outer membrane protein assembly factor BamB